MTPAQLWPQLLDYLKLQLTRPTFNHHLARSQLLPVASNPMQLVVAVPNPYSADWLNGRFWSLVNRSATELAGRPLVVKFIEAGADPMFPEERIHDYLTQYEEPIPALSRAMLYPPNGDPMSTNEQRVRIHSHVTQSKFLHLEDALGIMKLRLFGGEYRKGQGAKAHTHHFIDLADARVLFAMLMAGREGYTYKEYKGTPTEEGSAISRVLSVKVKGDNVYIELKSGPGKLTATGAITPAGKADVDVNVSFKLAEARRMAATVLAYIRAWDVCRMMHYQHLHGGFPPFELSPTANETANGRSQPARLQRPQVAATKKPVQTGSQRQQSAAPAKTAVPARPVTSRNSATQPAPVQRTVPAAVLQPTKPTGQVYGDGTAVDGENETEVATFKRFVKVKGETPASKEKLLEFYKQAGAPMAA